MAENNSKTIDDVWDEAEFKARYAALKEKVAESTAANKTAIGKLKALWEKWNKPYTRPDNSKGEPNPISELNAILAKYNDLDRRLRKLERVKFKLANFELTGISPASGSVFSASLTGVDANASAVCISITGVKTGITLLSGGTDICDETEKNGLNSAYDGYCSELCTTKKSAEALCEELRASIDGASVSQSDVAALTTAINAAKMII